MIYAKTPITKKEPARTRKIQTKTKPKTAERKKKSPHSCKRFCKMAARIRRNFIPAGRNGTRNV